MKQLKPIFHLRNMDVCVCVYSIYVNIYVYIYNVKLHAGASCVVNPDDSAAALFRHGIALSVFLGNGSRP